MELQIPLALQVALYAASVAIIVLAVVVVRAMRQLEKQWERVVNTVETIEGQLTPLAREARVVVDRLSSISGSAQNAVAAASSVLLPPVRIVNRASQILRTGAAAFLQALWAPGARTRHSQL
jgi:uncharacterized protein YoxC